MPADGGVMVFLSSQMGHVGAPSRSAYCATKHAVEGMTRALAVELAPRGVRVVVARADVRGDGADRALPRGPGLPRGRAGARSRSAGSRTAEEVAAAAVFAASPAAGS